MNPQQIKENLNEAHVWPVAVLQPVYDFTTYLRFSHYVYKYPVSGCTFHYFWMSASQTPSWAQCCKSANGVQVSAVKPCNLLSSASDLKVFNPRFCRFLIRRLYSSLKPFQGTMPSVSPHETRQSCGSDNMPFYWKRTAGCTSAQAPLDRVHVAYLNKSHFVHLAFKNQLCVRSITGTSGVLPDRTPCPVGNASGTFSTNPTANHLIRAF